MFFSWLSFHVIPWPAQQGVVGSFKGLVLLRVLLQPGIVLQQLLHVGLGALHLQHLAAQLALQVLTSTLSLLQQTSQFTSLQAKKHRAHQRAEQTGCLVLIGPVVYMFTYIKLLLLLILIIIMFVSYHIIKPPWFKFKAFFQMSSGLFQPTSWKLMSS